MKKAILAILVVWAWYVIWDNLLGRLFMGSVISQIPGILDSYPKTWEILGEFFSALVLVGVYHKVKASFNPGVGGGFTYGLYAGILINFPGLLRMTVYAGWPYAATWVFVIVGTLITVVSGILISVVYGRTGTAKAA